MSAEEHKTKGIIGEAIVILAVVAGTYLYISLLSFDLADVGASPTGTVSNYGGRLGLELAHGLLYVFGRSSYLVIVFLIYALWLYVRLLRQESFSWVSFISSFCGLALLLISTCGIEALRVYGDADALPGHSGGILGFGIAKTLFDILGFYGASLILVGMWLASISLYALFSWAELCDRIGDFLGGKAEYLHAARAGIAKAYAWVFEEMSSRRPDEPPIRSTTDERPKRERGSNGPSFGFKPKKAEPKPARGAEPELESKPKKKPAKPKASNGNGAHEPPPMDLLAAAMANAATLSDDELHELAQTIEGKLEEFGVKAKVVEILPGPVVTRFEIQPATGVKGAQVINLVRDLSRALSVSSIRVLETIEGKTTMGLEVPNAQRTVVSLQEIINSPAYIGSKSPLTLALGKDIAGEPFVADLAEMPHLLVAGTTGSGKSVQINSMILSLLYKSPPEQVRLILIDPKVVELAPFDNLPHLLAPVVTDMREVPTVLGWCVEEMERRYRLMARLGVRNLAGLNEAIANGAEDPEAAEDDEPLKPLPMLVVVVDELADLMAVAGKKVEQLIARLAQKARAAGIHLILATQRPSVDVITGLIKANIPSRIGFQVSSKIDSRTILDQAGAEALLGKGDMLYLPGGKPTPKRVHGAFVSDEEVHKVTDHIRKRNPETEKVEFELSNGLDLGENGEGSDNGSKFEQAIEVVRKNQRISISMIQRYLRIGYNGAARIVEDMERAGIVSPPDAAGNRKILKLPKKDKDNKDDS